MREALTAYLEQNGLKASAVAKPLGVKQQNVSRFLRGGGISHKTANNLASLLGFRDAEQLIREGRAMRGLRLAGGSVWASRDSAVRVAEAVGYAPEAIAAVVGRYKEPADAERDVKWWLNKIVLEELERRSL